jgi:hypothetical protein
MVPYSTNFFQNVIKFHKNWLKLAKIGNTVIFHVFEVVEHTPDSLRTIRFQI